MNYLLDTCVVSEATKRVPTPRVLNWLAERDEETLFLSVLTLGELENGVARLPASRKRERIRQWIDTDLRARFEGRILDVDAAVAIRWGQLTVAGAAGGRPLSVIDGLLAATALVRNLIVVTRNVADLDVGGVQIFDPWAA